jgi:hypothetical protein
MPYVVGIVLSVGVALFARRVGFDRDRALYPTVLIVIASQESGNPFSKPPTSSGVLHEPSSKIVPNTQPHKFPLDRRGETTSRRWSEVREESFTRLRTAR